MKEEKKKKIFLALTQIHREIKNNNNSCKISWYKEFNQCDFKNPNEISLIKKALIKMNIIKFNKEGRTYSWNKEKTVPNPLLIDGIYKTISENYKSKKNISKKVKNNTNISKKDINITITINGIPIDPGIVSISI